MRCAHCGKAITFQDTVCSWCEAETGGTKMVYLACIIGGFVGLGLGFLIAKSIDMGVNMALTMASGVTFCANVAFFATRYFVRNG